MNLSPREFKIVKIGGIAAAVLIIFSFYFAPSLSSIRSHKRSYEYNMKKYEEFLPLASKYLNLKKRIDSEKNEIIKSKISKDSFREAFSRLVSSAGISPEAFEVQFSGTRKIGNLSETSFNIEGKNLTYAEILRLVQRIEEGQERFIIKDAKIKTTFESDEYLVISMKVSLVNS